MNTNKAKYMSSAEDGTVVDAEFGRLEKKLITGDQIRH